MTTSKIEEGLNSWGFSNPLSDSLGITLQLVLRAPLSVAHRSSTLLYGYLLRATQSSCAAKASALQAMH